MTVVCQEPADTARLGGRLASRLKPGDVLVLSGELGCGKTLFTGGVAMGLGVDEPITSPSFVLVRRYQSGFIPLVHADVYRLGSKHEFEDLDLWGEPGVLVVEWGDVVEDFLPADHLRIDFEVADDDSRVVKFIPHGSWIDR
ncbi:MAG: tRNA (adenosine(37)-N6)-threonylcarbamoyltransferase complex ATPase subunit type 1 TsaE, partial [Acidimicrobiia bacterium]